MPDRPKPFKVKANDFVFTFDQDEVDKADLFRKTPTEFNLIQDNRSVNATLTESDVSGKKLLIEVEGEPFRMEIRDELDQMLDSMGFSTVSSKHIREIKAPMPGLVIEVSVQEGQEVMEGDRLLILEAMKMENSIMIQHNATIKRIAVRAGEAVDKGQVLIELA